MKILSTSQIKSVDRFTIENTPISSMDLMERAGTLCAQKIKTLFPHQLDFIIFCGTGNNGGDGLVVARILADEGKKVSLIIVPSASQSSPEFDINFERINPRLITQHSGLPIIEPNTVIIDALLGNGITRKMDGLLSDIAHLINAAKNPVISIDIPSGVFANENIPNNLKTAVRADYTLGLQIPKLAFFLSDTSEHIGNWELLDIGLNEAYIESLPTPYTCFTERKAALLLHKRDAFSHKGTYGHALIAAGSYGKIGACILASNACFRSGVGLLTVLIPKCGYEIIQESIPEAMVLTAPTENLISGDITFANYTACSIGPGIGTAEATVAFMRRWIQKCTIPMVLDADALNCIAQHPELLEELPPKTILTPHPKEFERLFGKSTSSFAQIQLLESVARKYQLIIVLKGHHTAICFPDGTISFNTSGNAGMATAGSGDTLTGMICSLLAQKYIPEEAAQLGVYLHGLAGDFAAKEMGQESMIASDIISHIGKSFQYVHSHQEK